MRRILLVLTLALLAGCGGSSGPKVLTTAQLATALPTGSDVPAGFMIAATTAAPTGAKPTGLGECDAQNLTADLPVSSARAGNMLVGTTIRYQVDLQQSTTAASTASLDAFVALGRACPMLTTVGMDGRSTSSIPLVITEGTLAGHRALTLGFSQAGSEFYGRIVDVDGVFLDVSNGTQKGVADHASLDNLAAALVGRVEKLQKG